jgi:anti-sigma factor RsiW
MPKTETTSSGETDRGCESAEALQDERIAAMVSAYLDGELPGSDLEQFKALLRDNEAFSREVAEMRRIDRQLTELGADILAEPIPASMLQALSKLAAK